MRTRGRSRTVRAVGGGCRKSPPDAMVALPKRAAPQARLRPETREPSRPAQGGGLLRRLIAAVMAVPVLASLYLALVLSHRRARRAGIGAAGAVGVMLVALIGIGLASPATSVSLPPSQSSPLPPRHPRFP